jgi:hypothetical protein
MFAFLARKTFHSLKDKSAHMTFHAASVIEARSDEEMPERVALCGFKINLKGFDAASNGGLAQ